MILHYNEGKDEYEVEQNLAPEEQIWLDVSRLIQNQIADKKGRTIPLNVQSGSYSIYDRKNVIGATLFEGKLTVDKTFGHASYGCSYCCVPGDPVMVPSSFSVPVGTGWQNSVFATNQCTNQPYDVSYKVTPWTATNSLVTVDGTGWAQGVSPGMSGVNGTILVPNLDLTKCPLQHVIVSNHGTVKPTLSGISPTRGLVGTSVNVTMSGSGFNGSNLSIQVAGITPTINSSTATQIQATFAIASNASGGNHAVTVTASGQTSSAQNFFVQIPSSLSVLSVGLANPNCAGSANYGVLADVKYQVWDQESPKATILASGMIPHETGTFFDGSPLDSDIGAPSASDGTFHDVPLGLCSNLPISDPGRTATQNVTMKVGANSYSVRSQTITVKAPGSQSFGHGTISNNLGDISATR